MKKIVHWLAHMFRKNQGNVITFEEDGYICVAFKCKCGKISRDSIVKTESENIYGKFD
jgi:hypothetical protein